ncbi:tRNA (adenosine(37)-N6)-threonylcarbamoyltransferase complex dimerization subunit type 1 TsaB [Ammonifex thiophilus]|uniref:tRNA (Adenosine(37)-N6)-threonylcarbamoyltransferase complex dimerization subunit type 1 TsaB n=1 Tax=Ammonifex thiophilus TaxID=444093 RepID=A0A3D8P530_9THEO|nr:tRNA (adenosine(37)-N6)-threonylcarbamoyltransferase complex dimerization subunit type 1 TsaB [Ammonifex thiophilus]RDV84340.1 tRNA (adenosine(37)-N6)-threonylcarbamoyltransferase complex dimerization subunit type 1 TsaB [Ammonifex thiophilus]
MRLVLGIETSTAQALGVAVVGEEGLLAEATARGEKRHAEYLFSFIEWVLKSAEVKLEELSGIAVSIGPGSFTGIRLGVAVAKTLAQVLSLPVFGVPTLEVLALPWSAQPLPVCPLVPSRRQEVFAALYRRGELLKGPWAASPAEVAAELRSLDSVLLTGAGAGLYASVFRELLGERVVFPVPLPDSPSAQVIAFRGLELLRQGARGDLFELSPLYLRPPAISGGG